MSSFAELLTAATPLVFAHRGGAGLAPENTLAAFERAAALGVDGFELDVHLSRDGVPVVVHDATLDRTTGASGRVSARSADELAQVDAAARFPPGSGRPQAGGHAGVPRLADVLARHPAMPLIVEIKENSAAAAQAVIEVVRTARAAGHVCVGSFGSRALREVRRRAPEIVTSAGREEIRWALYRSWFGLRVRNVAYRVFQVPERHGLTRIVSPGFVRYARSIGCPVQVWTVNDEADMRRLAGWGVNALITDRPDTALHVVGRGR